MGVNSIIEICGLSGIGKSTTCENLKLSCSEPVKTISPIVYRYLKRSYIDRFFIFITAFKYRSVFYAIHCGKDSQYVFIAWMIKLVLRAMITKKSEDTNYDTKSISILLSLNRVRLIYGIARIEAKLRNADFIIDDGYILRAQSIWLRVPEKSRRDALDAYIRAIPKRHLCVFIKSEYSEAIRRSKIRNNLFRRVFYSYINDNNGVDINDIYLQLSNMFNKVIISRRIPVVTVNQTTDYDMQTEIVLNKVVLLKKRSKTIIWVCC
jgi:hypothetical protein